MNRNRWLLPLGVGLIVVFCCYLSVCGLAGFLVARSSASRTGIVAPTASQDPTPIATRASRQPLAIEDETARVLANSTLPERDLFDLAHRLQGLPEPLDWQPPQSPPQYELGDVVDFWIHDEQSNQFFTSTATLAYATSHAYWWVEEGYEIPAQDLRRSAENFENKTYPTDHSYFGSEWDPGIDGDPHVYILLAYVPGVGGYFSGPDEYPTVIRPHSNEHEMFYINLENAMPGNDYFDGILAHEFQHMIHWAEDRDETTWVNEGLSELAAQVNGYDVGGSDYMFSLAPDTQLTTWSELEDSAPHYGASYLFMSYFLEQYGQQAIRQLVAEPANGLAGLNAVLSQVDPSGRRAQDLFTDWVVANYLDDTRLDGGRFGYGDLQVDRPEIAALYNIYPVHQQATVHQYAADYILLEGQGDLTIDFAGSTIVPLVGNETHSGDYQWWSNRADDSDATLTRAFDLTGLGSATLQAWMWYNLEADYDYAYVEVSADGGDTWHILANEHTTTTNPSGNSYGPGLTGFSGGGQAPRWSQEAFDLTPYSGQPILIRFEVITDEGLNYAGLCVDDLSIPELGYAYDVEDGDGGWQAEGWVRVTDTLPEQFLVQVITLGRQTQVEQMDLNAQMHGEITVSGLGQEVSQAVLVVSALAPVTTEWAAYSYDITQR
jgi:immune inhibitor A